MGESASLLPTDCAGSLRAINPRQAEAGAPEVCVYPFREESRAVTERGGNRVYRLSNTPLKKTVVPQRVNRHSGFTSEGTA